MKAKSRPLALLVQALVIVLLVVGVIRFRQIHIPAPSSPPAAVVAPTTVDVLTVERPLSSLDAAAYVGDLACRRCHPDIYEQQSRSNHARTLRRVSLAADGAYFQHSNKVTDSLRDYVYHSIVSEGNCMVEYRGPSRHGSLKADLAIGSGRNGRTFLSQARTGEWIDLRVSYYTRAGGWDFTPMQQPFVSAAQHPEGVHLADQELTRCLLCHSTLLLAKPSGLDIPGSHLGIGCERCHGPGRAHAREGQKLEDLHSASPDRITELCGTCHETAADAPPGTPTTEGQLPRFEGAALVRSRCYQESKALSCITCHNPHSNSDPDVTKNDGVCLGCHSPGHTSHTIAGTPPGPGFSQPNQLPRVCPVNPLRGCINCHMPKQSMQMESIDVAPHTLYRNHWIKVWNNPSQDSSSK